jgi:hypothetical protein
MLEQDKLAIEAILGKYSPEEKFAFYSSGSQKVCRQNKWGNPFVPGRSQEIVVCNILGFTISNSVSGADAYDADGPAEIKSCSPGEDAVYKGKFDAVYGGISFFPTWEEQLEYLDQKILAYKNHYHSRWENGECMEIWQMDCQTVYDLLLPKLKKRYETLKANDRIKDPRMQGVLTKKQIYKHGKKVYDSENNA